MTQELPVVVFGMKRPAKLSRILDSLRRQQVDRLVIFIDGPRNDDDLPGVEACRALARGVDFAPCDLHLWQSNRGLPGLVDNLTLAFEAYPWAVVVEDDCLPMPGFYAFMRRALERYAAERSVFSIGGYQPLPAKFFRGDRRALVPSARFNCWGWATWRERWQRLLPDIRTYDSLFDKLQNLSDIAGADMPLMARGMASGELPTSWDIQVAVAAMAQRQVHLIATRGLVRNIGLDRSGFHGGFAAALRDRFQQNRNLSPEMPPELELPDDVRLDMGYAAALRHFVAQTQVYTPRRVWARGRTLARRYLLPGYERRLDMDLRPGTQPALTRRALLSYIVHPFSIPRLDLRFLRHINIFHAQEMVRALNHLGYRVDVVDYRDTAFQPQQPYDLFIGHGGVNFNLLAERLSTPAPCLYLATGSYWRFHNEQETARFDALAQRRGLQLPPDRLIKAGEEAALQRADGIIGIGNAFTRQTYAAFERVVMLNGTTLSDDSLDWRPRDLAAAQGNFLYFASGGNVHKGLDRVLEAFDGLPYRLWIIAPLEVAFEKAYRRELALPNIHPLGWVQPRSARFYEVMAQCSFCILPSCSEGQSQSVIEAMQQGLLPLVSRAAGVDVDGFGFYLEPPEIEEIRRVVQRSAALPPGEIAARAARARQAAQTTYGEAAFGPRFAQAVQSLLEAYAAGG